MQVLFCPSFLKELKKIRSVHKEDITKLLKKYPHTKEIIQIDQFEGNEVLKCYLLSKKIRALVLLCKLKEKFVPISVIRKETQKGKNISKENYVELFKNDISKIMSEVESNNYEEEYL